MMKRCVAVLLVFTSLGHSRRIQRRTAAPDQLVVELPMSRLSLASDLPVLSETFDPAGALVKGIEDTAVTAGGMLLGSRKSVDRHVTAHEIHADPEGGDTSRKKFEKDIEEVRKDVEKVAAAPETVPAQAKRDTDDAKQRLLPGWQFKKEIFYSAMICISMAGCWFAVYFCCAYRTDRSVDLDHWQSRDEYDDSEQPTTDPDLVLVFHHPECPRRDQKEAVYRESFESCLSTGRSGAFKHTEEQLSGSKRRHERLGAPSWGWFSPSNSHREDDQNESPPEVTEVAAPSKRSVRGALLRDMYENLCSWGFDVQIFSSIDDEELYLCASLIDEDVVDYYLLRDQYHLQINQDVVAKMGITQPSDEKASSPPYVRYDLRLVERLHTAGVLQHKNERDLYRCHFDQSRRGSIMNGLTRVRVIHKEISRHLDLDGAQTAGLIANWYPGHSEYWLKKLNNTWASPKLVGDASFVQPIPMIKDYLGSRVAFSFAWNGLYCKCLIALLPVALVGFALTLIGRLSALPDWNDRQVLGFSVVLAVWSRLAYNLWQREQSYFTNLFAEHAEEDTVRPAFRGFPEPSEIDLNDTVRSYPKHWADLRFYISWSITVLFCAVVALFIVVWIDIFSGRMDLISSMFLSMQIKIFEYIFNNIVDSMTEFENHMHQADYYNSYLSKQFIFHSVNNYAVFFYLTVKGTHWGVDYLPLLRWYLETTFVMLALCRIGEVLFDSVSVKMSLWFEMYKMTSRSEIPPPRSFAEEQSKYAEFRSKEQIEAMLQLVLSLGYVLIFGVVAPITVPLCFLVFAVQLRASAHLLCHTAKRAVPWQHAGIGHWQWCVALLMRVGVLFEGFLLVSFGESFKGTELLAKLTGVILFFLAGIVIWAMVDALVPGVDKEAELLSKRRAHVEKKILETTWGVASAKKDLASSPVNPKSKKALHAMMVNGHWDSIPHLDGSPVRRS
eukprot:gnl/TRDRNA2_/TRDRNA2_172601_c0_seq1.p1 gnl/TRDRNA2_/TRDRNA2_172601_c0~~gnl/TRDRNA2_/TRDRNA2_172601_c0_seq1.p1  ORF type:complete len:952 (-),score=137.05 gnl/TRDRNA2_/TRDRNA2_172601_c0_seq1:125-2980(-)